LLINAEFESHSAFGPNVTEVVVVILPPIKVKVISKILLEFDAGSEVVLNVAFPRYAWPSIKGVTAKLLLTVPFDIDW
jgi:hypothetical protein